MNKLLSILTIVLMLTACASNPPTEDNSECAWTDPVKVSGTGTGSMEYIGYHVPDFCDVCVLAPMYGMIETLDDAYRITLDGNIMIVEGHGTFVYNYVITDLVGDCASIVIEIIFIFPDEPENYAIGDTWTFGLE